MEEDFEFLDNSTRGSSPTPSSPNVDFEVIETQRVRTLDDIEDIVVHEDYFIADAKTNETEAQATTSEESLSEDDFVPVRRSKRNKKPKTKAKKGLQTLSDVKCKIPPKVKNRSSSSSS